MKMPFLTCPLSIMLRYFKLCLFGASVILLQSCGGSSSAPTTASNIVSVPSWTAVWATAQHVDGPELSEQSIRMVVRLSQGGKSLRVRLGNRLGTTPLQVGQVTVAPTTSGPAIDAAGLRSVTFDGQQTASVPAGGDLWSDPVNLPTMAQQQIAVSVYVRGTALPSAHTGAFRTNYLTPAGAGDATRDASGSAFNGTTTAFLVVNAVDVKNSSLPGAVVVIGGSVVDGIGSEKTGIMGAGPAAPVDSRWSDVLARRIVDELPIRQQYSVVQAGISGNTAAPECALNPPPYGNVQDRLDADVFSLSDVRYVILYAGTNDIGIGTGCTVEQILAAYDNIVLRARAHGARVIVSTITPRASYTPLQNSDRQYINSVILADARNGGGRFDAVVDFDTAMKWSAYPNAIDPALDSGDSIHPNAEGYAAMAHSIDLRLLSAK
ncbi:MAG: lysophospholipase L1-like esterase [Janthinobacterium sp.]|jgi:lysophospholipase L1-like esterase